MDTERGIQITGITVLAKKDVSLKSLNGFQALATPKHTIGRGRVSLIGIEILSVYPGTKYKDTCVSEIRN